MNRSARIVVMPRDLALKIAAGEVVERPASAVMELLDNAVDAGASTITVDAKDAGLKLIQVVDDGRGIAADELHLAFHSHATSKITTLDDLQHLSTLGFRGEALPSIASISRIELRSRTDESAVGARITLEFGEAGPVTPCASPRGTRITVSDLFANVPARRAFVRSLRAEAGQIANLVGRYALAHPHIRFTCALDGRTVVSTPGTGNLVDAACEILGAKTVSSMITLSAEAHGIAAEGIISAPDLTRANRTAIYLFVNGRSVANRSLAFALEEAYSGYVMTGRHPLAVVHLTLPAADVDANIHPSKAEVRFAREREVHSVLHRAVADALLREHTRNHTAELSTIDTESVTAAEQAAIPLPLVPATTQDAIPETSGMPALRVFGQANATFIIAEGPSGLYMIDQHAAHERIIFDRLDAQFDSATVPMQPLLEPASVTITPAQMSALEGNISLLHTAGFDVEPFGTDGCLVRAVPSVAGNSSPAELITEVLSEMENCIEPRAARERALASMACKAAVKAGSALDVAEMRELVLQLERTPRPATCPHGRPTMIHLSHSQLEREFGRR
jgi:DNA mismatch repair protein MutL